MAGLGIQIGADISDLQDGVDKAERQLRRLQERRDTRLRLGIDVSGIDARINSVTQNLNTLRGSLNSTTTSINAINRSAGNGGNTLMQFSRIAQDAPFGIMGIGNNITATAESFGHLVRQTGSAGGALRSVAASIMGTGGILLAVSLVTSALTYMSQNGLSVGDVFNKLTGDFNEYADALKKANLAAYDDSGVVSAVQNVNQLREEVRLAKDGFIDKNKVVDHYNDTMGKTAGIVSTLDQVEQQLVKNGPNYIKMQLYKATATLAQAEAAKELLNKEKISKESAEKYIGALGYTKAALQGVASGNVAATFSSFAFTNGLKNQSEELSNSTKKMNANLSVAEKYNKLAAEISKKSGFNFFGDNKKDSTKKETTKKRADLLPVSTLGTIDNEKLKTEGKKVIKTFEDSLGSELKIFKDTKIPLEIPLQPILPTTTFTELQLALIKFNEDASSLIENSIGSTFSRIGDTIGDALSNGTSVIGAIGSSLLSSLGSFLSDMGGLLIKYGTLAVLKGKLDLAILSGGPVSIAAGLAAIGVGVLLKAAGGAIGGLSSKGGSSGSTSTGANYSSPASSGNFSSSSGGGGTVVFEISGQSLIGVLSNTLDRNSRLGGSLGIG